MRVSAKDNLTPSYIILFLMLKLLPKKNKTVLLHVS